MGAAEGVGTADFAGERDDNGDAVGMLARGEGDSKLLAALGDTADVTLADPLMEAGGDGD